MAIARSAGADIHYEVVGDGEPVLLIMGFSADLNGWMAQRQAFSERFRTVLFDNRGAGRSTRTPGPYGISLMADDALAVMDAAGLERAHIVGISLGGAIAQHVALRAPERTRSLTLAATWGRQNGYTERIAEVGTRVAENLGIDALVKTSLLFLFTPQFIISQHQNLMMLESMFLSFVPPLETFVAQLHAVLEHDVMHRLHEIHAPTLVLTGRRDTMVPPELSYELADAITGSRLVELGSGHAFNIEEAEEFNRTILEFLDKH